MPALDVSPSARVSALIERYDDFLADEVAPLEVKLAEQGVGTAWAPALDEYGRMHRTVWEARREVQRRSAAAGLYAPHMASEVGGGGLSRVEMMHVEGTRSPPSASDSASKGRLGHLLGSDVMPVLLDAVDRSLFLGSRPTDTTRPVGLPVDVVPLRP